MNIIKAVFGGGRFAKTAPVFQWNYGDRLQFIGIDLPATYEVHFANSYTGTSVTALGDENGVEIPASVFQPGTEAYAWVYLTETGAGWTKYQVTIPIYKRAQPTNETPTPAQQSALDSAIALLNEAAEDLSEAEQGIPNAIDAALQEAKDSGEFDGADGNNAWLVDASATRIVGSSLQAQTSAFVGPTGATPQMGDVLIVSDGNLCEILAIAAGRATCSIIGNLTGPAGADGTDGYSPTVTVETITGGHRVTITDANGDHVFDVMDGTGSSITVDDALSPTSENPVQNKVVYNAFQQAAFALDDKVDKVTGKGLSTNDYTDEDAQKVSEAATENWVTQQGFISTMPTASDVGALPDTTKYAGAETAGGPANKAVSIPMGALNNTSTATAMTASVSGITELRDGVCMWLRNSVVTSAAGVTLDINGLGAKPIYNSIAEATATSTTFSKSYTMLFIFNSTRVTGGCWDMVYGYDSNTTSSPAKLGQGYAECSTAAATLAKTASISSYALTTGGIVSIKFTYDVPANATLNVTSKGAKAIYYKGAAITDGIIKAGDTATFIYSTNYHLIAIDRAAEAYEKPSGGIPSSDMSSTVQTLLGKANTALQPPASPNNGDVLTYSSGVWGAAALPKEVFWCTYGTTTSAEIEAALAADKIPAVMKDDTLYVCGFKSSATKHYFGSSCPQSRAVPYIVADNGTWSKSSITIPSTPADIGAEPAVTEVTVSDAGAVTQALDAGKIYHFTGALTSLTITLNAAQTGQLAQYHFDFVSGSTAPTVTLPGTVTMQGGTFTPEASKHYEVDILNGYGVSMAW